SNAGGRIVVSGLRVSLQASRAWPGSTAHADTVCDDKTAVPIWECPTHALLLAVMRVLEKVEMERIRRLQRLSRQGWLEDIPPALLAGVQGEAA
ncbi:MAG: hypothetical protein ACRC1L_00075, partial [Prochlorococcaceae cyanobacterium]